MKNLQAVINYLEKTMPTPQVFGWFHLTSLAIMIIGAILIVLFLKKTNEKQNKIILSVYVITCLLFEIYKQIIFSFDVVSGKWSVQWYIFPFQLCSTPMYIALIALFTKKGKFQNALYAYLATFGMLAGLLVMIYPVGVYVTIIGINIQTMYHHATQFLIGFYLLVCGRVKIDYKTPLNAFVVFLTLVAIAVWLNIIVTNFVTKDLFNMFFISPYFPTSLPMLDVIYKKVSYIIFLLLYIFAFLLGVYILYLPLLIIKSLSYKQNRIYKLDNKKTT